MADLRLAQAGARLAVGAPRAGGAARPDPLQAWPVPGSAWHVPWPGWDPPARRRGRRRRRRSRPGRPRRRPRPRSRWIPRTRRRRGARGGGVAGIADGGRRRQTPAGAQRSPPAQSASRTRRARQAPGRGRRPGSPGRSRRGPQRTPPRARRSLHSALVRGRHVVARLAGGGRGLAGVRGDVAPEPGLAGVGALLPGAGRGRARLAGRHPLAAQPAPQAPSRASTPPPPRAAGPHVPRSTLVHPDPGTKHAMNSAHDAGARAGGSRRSTGAPGCTSPRRRRTPEGRGAQAPPALHARPTAHWASLGAGITGGPEGLAGQRRVAEGAGEALGRRHRARAAPPEWEMHVPLTQVPSPPAQSVTTLFGQLDQRHQPAGAFRHVCQAEGGPVCRDRGGPAAWRAATHAAAISARKTSRPSLIQWRFARRTGRARSWRRRPRSPPSRASRRNRKDERRRRTAWPNEVQKAPTSAAICVRRHRPPPRPGPPRRACGRACLDRARLGWASGRAGVESTGRGGGRGAPSSGHRDRRGLLRGGAAGDDLGDRERGQEEPAGHGAIGEPPGPSRQAIAVRARRA